MQTIYQINADELDQNLLDSIKILFKHKEIEIVINERDETAFALRPSASRESSRGLQEVEENGGIVISDQDFFQ